MRSNINPDPENAFAYKKKKRVYRLPISNHYTRKNLAVFAAACCSLTYLGDELVKRLAMNVYGKQTCLGAKC